MDAFWLPMQLGFTADESRLVAEAEYRDWVYWNIGDLLLPEVRDLIHCYGDWFTRLHGVYTGQSNDSPMAAWFGLEQLL